MSRTHWEGCAFGRGCVCWLPRWQVARSAPFTVLCWHRVGPSLELEQQYEPRREKIKNDSRYKCTHSAWVAEPYGGSVE